MRSIAPLVFFSLGSRNNYNNSSLTSILIFFFTKSSPFTPLSLFLQYFDSRVGREQFDLPFTSLFDQLPAKQPRPKPRRSLGNQAPSSSRPIPESQKKTSATGFSQDSFFVYSPY
jgi:hypothetical protein